MNRILPVFLALCVLPIASLAQQQGTAPAFRPGKIRELDAAITQAIADGKCPGGVLWLEHAGTAYHRAFGNRCVEPAAEPMTEETIFDVASLTKVIATTTAVMLLVEKERVQLAERVQTYLPEFTGDGREKITVRQLLTHTSGLRPDLPPGGPAGYEATLDRVFRERPTTAPDTAFRYSDLNFILLGALVARVSGMPLNEFCAERIFGPLKMRDTLFLPPVALRGRIAPTTRETPRGTVHDPTAQLMGGVAGHAGLFATAADLARFTRMLLGGGSLESVHLLRPETVQLMTTVQSPTALVDRRGLGWDIDSRYSGPRGTVFPIGSYGHSGWTGGSLWIDPASETFVIFLSNRNHPTEAGNVNDLRKVIGTLAAEAVGRNGKEDVGGGK
jgi:CubicO group peptidase (beta-lactamase class C family)